MDNIFKKARENKEIVAVSAAVSALVCLLVGLVVFFALRGNLAAGLSRNVATSSALVADAAPAGVGSESDIIETVQNANPSVVSIVISKDVPIIQRRTR